MVTDSKDFEDDSLKYVVKEMRYLVPKYSNPCGFRIIDAMPNIELPKGIVITGEAVGEEGEYELVQDPLVIKAGDFKKAKESKEWQMLEEGNKARDYKAFRVKFPGEGLVLDGKEAINEFIEGFAIENINTIDEEGVYKGFEEMAEQNKSPNLSCYYYAKDKKNLSSSIDTEITFHTTKDKVVTRKMGAYAVNSLDISTKFLYTQPDTLGIKKKYETGNWISGESDKEKNFYVGNFVGISTSERFFERGLAYDNEAKNLTYYYLVPIGIEPLKEQTDFKEVIVKSSNREGYQLIIAKPKNKAVLNRNSYDTGADGRQDLMLQLEVKEWAKPGKNTIYAVALMDNNKPVYFKGRANGYAMHKKIKHDSPFYGVHRDGENTPIDSTYFDDMGSKEITVSPPYQLIGLTQVKLKNEEDKAYGSFMGRKITKESDETDINYRHEFKNESNSDIEKMAFLNILPRKGDLAPAPDEDGIYKVRGSAFSTPLTGKAASKEDLFDFFYSQEFPGVTMEENLSKTFVNAADTANWTEENWAKVTMIKGVLKSGKKIEKHDTVYVVTPNKVPKANKFTQSDYAANSMAFIVGKDTLEPGGSVEGHEARVNIFFPKRNVKLKKIDKDTGKGLLGAGFTLYKKGSSEPVFQELFTNSKGELTFSGLEVGETYILKESTVPGGYDGIEEKEFTVKDVKVLFEGSEVDEIVIKNEKEKKSNLVLSKTVTGNMGDMRKKFKFNLTILAKGAPLTGKHEAENEKGIKRKITFANGKASV